METKTTYVAADGKEFETETECHAYEGVLGERAVIDKWLTEERELEAGTRAHTMARNYIEGYLGFRATAAESNDGLKVVGE